MKYVAASYLVAMLSLSASAQQNLNGADSGVVQRSSSPGGIQIKGNNPTSESSFNADATTVGQSNTAKTSTPDNQVQIRGNTRIKASGRDLSTVAVGKDNKAGNTVGSVGGN